MGLVAEEARSPPVGRIANEDLTGLGRLLEAGGDVHRVAEHAELAVPVADRPRDREAGVHADPQREAALGLLHDALIRALQRREDRERGALGLFWMVRGLVAHGAEHRDERVADVLLDDALVRPDVGGDQIPDRAHALVELFRAEPLGERRESGDIREQHGDLARLTRPVIALAAQPSAAPAAEQEALRHVGAAASAARAELEAALAAEAHADRIRIATRRTEHGLAEGSTTRQAVRCRSGSG